jgi:hypothetical protein
MNIVWERITGENMEGEESMKQTRVWKNRGEEVVLT